MRRDLDSTAELPALDVDLPFWWQLRIGLPTVLYTAVLALGGAALVALLPAIKATSPRVQTALTKLGSGGTNMRFGGVWSLVIVLQVTGARPADSQLPAAPWGLSPTGGAPGAAPGGGGDGGLPCGPRTRS